MRDDHRSLTTRRGRMALVVAVIGGVFAAGVSHAQDGRALLIDVADCVEIESPSERFRCYEAKVDAALGETRESDAARAAEVSGVTAESTARAAGAQSGGVTPARELELEAAPSVNESDFGLRRSNKDLRRERRREREQREELFGTVASVRETVPNSYVVTLENGQVWRQVRPKFYPLRPGHQVRIYSTGWGDDYRMSAEGLNGFIQVERVR